MTHEGWYAIKQRNQTKPNHEFVEENALIESIII